MADEPEWARQPPPAPPAAEQPAASPEPDWAKPAPAPSNEPAWARTPAPAPAPSLNERVGAAVVGAAIGAAKPPMDMSFLNLPKPILAMRFMNVLSAFMLSFCAITKLMTTDRLAPGIVAIYIFIFAVAIFLFELHIPQLGRGLAENLGFLYSAMGRFWFLILVAILAASGHGLWGIFTVILVVCTAIVVYSLGAQRSESESLGCPFWSSVHISVSYLHPPMSSLRADECSSTPSCN